MKEKKKMRIVLIGGGTGASYILSGLAKYPVAISAIISTADNGSSSGILRKKFNMVPPGDIRQCLVGLAANKELAHYCNVRFSRGNLYGHPLGNILLALLYDYHGDTQKAVDEMCALLGIRGHEVLPATLGPATLIATLADKTKIKGEKNIARNKNLQKETARLSLLPKKLLVNPRALYAIKKADAIIVGPGNLFTSILPALLPCEIKNALVASRAKKICVANLMTQKGQTENFSPNDFVRMIEAYAGNEFFNAVFYNTAPIPQNFWNKNVGFKPVIASKQERMDSRFIPGKFVKNIERANRNDPINFLRSLVVHDEDAIAGMICTYLKCKSEFRNPKSETNSKF